MPCPSGSGVMAVNSTTERIATLELDDGSIIRRTPEVEHERAIAIQDLLTDNLFAPVECEGSGPYNLFLSEAENRITFHISSETLKEPLRINVPVQPFRSTIKDYFIICESYFAAIKSASPSKIEAIDMGRRGIHNEGSTLLMEWLEGKVRVDMQTARRLFTLICVLHIK